MDDADPALAGERDREPRLGDGVHRRRDDRDRELDRRASAACASRPRSEARSDSAGTSRTSSNVSPSLANFVLQREEPLDLEPAQLHALQGERAYQSAPAVTPTPTVLEARATSTSGEHAPGLARVEAARTDLERRRRAGRDGAAERVLGGGRGVRGEEARRAARRPRRPPRPARPAAPARGSARRLRPSRNSAKQPASCVIRTLRAPSSAMRVEREREVLARSSNSWPTSASASRWLGETSDGSASTPEPQRLALRVEHRRHLAPVQLADRLARRSRRRRRAAASRRRRRTRRRCER